MKNPFSVGMDITSFELDLLAVEGTVGVCRACAGAGAGADIVGVPFTTSVEDISVRIIISPFNNPAEAKVSSFLALHIRGGYPIFTFFFIKKK